MQSELRIPRLRRIALVSVHTSPLDQPGIGDAGGLNVYVNEVARRLIQRDITVDVFTRATGPRQAPVEVTDEGLRVHYLQAGPLAPVGKAELPAHLCALASGLLRTGAGTPSDHFDAIHSHYWLSGQVGALASDRWNIPLVQSMHTLARVKNANLALDDVPEPLLRVQGEQQVVSDADFLIANTHDESQELIELYGADPRKVAVVHPGVDLEVFHPGSDADAKNRARQAHGIASDAFVALFVGRIQPLKGPDILIKATAALLDARPELRGRFVTVICGGPSGAGSERLDELRALIAQLNVSDSVRLEPPGSREELADWYRAADVTCVPSFSESFGLVAIESQASGTPVLASSVGGLKTAVSNYESGILIDSHDPSEWAHQLDRLVREPRLHAQLASGSRKHALDFGWDATTDQLMRIYSIAKHDRNVRHQHSA